MKKIQKALPVIFAFFINASYCFFGWCIYIFYDLTTPGKAKFFTESYVHRIVLPILMLCHFIGEIAFHIWCYKKLFYKKNVKFAIFAAVNFFIVYIFLFWIGFIEKLIG